jgi:hypothetical protein
MGNAIPQWSIDVANRLLATYVSPDRRLPDVEGFKAALIRAINKAHEEGLEAGLLSSDSASAPSLSTILQTSSP